MLANNANCVYLVADAQRLTADNRFSVPTDSQIKELKHFKKNNYIINQLQLNVIIFYK